jgi:heme A synthase
VVFGLAILLGLDEDGAEETMPPLTKMAVGAALYLVLVVASAYGGFVATKKAGGRCFYTLCWRRWWSCSRTTSTVGLMRLGGPPVDLSISLPHVFAAGVGGFVVLQRRRRHESENEALSE